MQSNNFARRCLLATSMLLFAAVIVAGCTQASGQDTSDPATDIAPAADLLMLPELQPPEADNRPLRVIATTSIIGDVVKHVGGNNIELTTLINAGSDPHSYQPAPRDLAAVAERQIGRTPQWLTPYLFLGQACAELGQKDKALANLRHVTRKAPLDQRYKLAHELLRRLEPQPQP